MFLNLQNDTTKITKIGTLYYLHMINLRAFMSRSEFHSAEYHEMNAFMLMKLVKNPIWLSKIWEIRNERLLE